GGNADTLVGGLGNDRYYIDLSDAIVENPGGGIDSIFLSDGSFVLPDAIENLALFSTADVTATGNAADNNLSAGGGNNLLSGLGGNDTLGGGSGNDTLIGGAGDDT